MKKHILFLALLFLLSCQSKPVPPELKLVEDMVEFYNDHLPAELPRFEPAADGAAIYLAGKSGERSFLLNPGAIDRERFQRDTLHPSLEWDYLTFYDPKETNFRYVASTYAPADDSRFGPEARVLELSTPQLYAKDNPEDNALGYLAVGLHEMAHMTDQYPAPRTLPNMMDQLATFEGDSLLRVAIKRENDRLLAAIKAPDAGARDAQIRRYLQMKASRARESDPLALQAENYYEFNEGYGRFVEHLLQERAGDFTNDFLTATLGALPPYRLEEREWMYRPVYNDYFYVLGFNKFRILAAAGDYSFVASLRGQSGWTLDDYLRRLVNGDS